MKKMIKRIAAAMLVTVLTFMSAGGSLTAEAAAKAPKKMSLKVTAKKIDIKGKATISVKSVKPSDASKAVKYKSSNKKVAAVSSKGVVTGKKAGKATITVTSKKNKKVKKTVKITVKNMKPTSLSLSASNLSMTVGEKAETKATVKPAGVYCPVSYKSSNLSVASVDKNGKVTAKAPGTAVITAKAKEKNSKGKYLSKTCKVTVSKKQVVYGEEFKGELVISASELKAKIDRKESMILVDARNIKATADTAKNAITMSWQDISDSSLSNRGKAGFARTLPPAEVSKKLSALGLGLNDQIFLFSDRYQTSGWGEDGRIAWQLIQCGYTNVRVVNGGFPLMKDAGIPTQKGPSKPATKTVNIANVDTTNEVTTEELLKDYASYKVVDVRTDDEFKGIKVEEGTTGGHMKDALQVRFTDMFRPDGTLKSNSELVRLFDAAGIKKTDKIATCCTGGIRSGYMQLVLKMLGYENSYNYAESVYRWSNTADAGTGDYWVQQ